MRRKRERRPWSLAARITALVIIVAALVGTAGSILTLQLLRTTLQQEARDELDRQLDRVLADEPEDIEDLVLWAESTATQWAIVSLDGALSGPAAPLVSEELVVRLLDQEDVSEVLFRFRQPVVLEGRPYSDGAIVLTRSDRVITESSRDLVLRTTPVLAVGIVIAFIGAALLARRITRPLVGTASAADLLTHGQRGVEVPETDIPEVRAVSEALVTLDRALATSEQRQREFLLSISHELRTPLTAIRGYGEALADGVVEPLKAGAIINDEARRLTRFVDDLLELARLEADDFTLAPTECDLRHVARDAVAAWEGLARRLDVTLARVETSDPVTVTTDALRVRQIVDGLLENAIRVSPPGSRVTLTVGAEGRHSIEVSDEGPGLSADDLEHAFERGVVRARYLESRPVGTGLGLSIAARLISRMGGTIAASEAPTGGTRFTVEFESSASP